MTSSLRRDQRLVVRVPSPQVLVGHFGPAPPAPDRIVADRVVAAEIHVVRDDRFAELCQREPAAQIDGKSRLLTTCCTKNETGARDVGNSTSLAPAPAKTI